MIEAASRWYTQLCGKAEPKAVAQRFAVHVAVLGLAFRLGRHLPTLFQRRFVAIQVYVGFWCLQQALRHLHEFTLIDVDRSKRIQTWFPNTDDLIEQHWDLLSAGFIAGFLAFQAERSQDELDITAFGTTILIWAAKKAYHVWQNRGAIEIDVQKFREEDMEKDGHCFFRAIAADLPLDVKIKVFGGEVSLGSTPEKRIQKLRHAAADLISGEVLSREALAYEIEATITDIRKDPFAEIQGGWPKEQEDELWAIATGLGDVAAVKGWHETFQAKYTVDHPEGETGRPTLEEWYTRQLQIGYSDGEPNASKLDMRHFELVITGPINADWKTTVPGRRVGVVRWYETFSALAPPPLNSFEYRPEADQTQRQLATARWYHKFDEREKREPNAAELIKYQRAATECWHRWYMSGSKEEPLKEEVGAQLESQREAPGIDFALKALRESLFGGSPALLVLAPALNVTIIVHDAEKTRPPEEHNMGAPTTIHLIKRGDHYNLLRIRV